jgi:hypothetical protein
MNKSPLIIICFLLLLSCNKKGNHDGGAVAQAAVKDTTQVNDSTQNPKIKVKVNRKFDDKGNLIRYDSTYSYYYESPKRRKGNIRSDSLFRQFKKSFQSSLLDSMNHEMSNIFFNDSLFQYDFFNDDYFGKRFELNQKRFQQMFRKVDSLKADMLKRKFPKGSLKKG